MQRVGPYELLGELGRGGMGVVHRARRDGADHDVALKVVAADAAASAEQLARFQREVRIARELDHPGIVRCLDAGEDGGTAWFAMELIEGEPLSKQIREREFTWQEAVTIIRDVSDALAVAHDKGVLHRDLKPSNILMDAAGKPHIADFGLAKDTRTESKYTRTGQTLGTPAYMSPEQARGDLAELTPASDVWSLGCVLYELLANRPAFEGDTPAAVIGAVLTVAPDFALLPKEARTPLRVCLQQSPSGRYRSAGPLRDDCDRLLRGERPLARVPRRRGPILAAAALGLAGAVALLLWPPDQAGETPAGPPVDAAAQQAAEAGWALRHSDPTRARELLAEACESQQPRARWRIQLGLLLWAAGRDEPARAAWEGVTEGNPEYARAQLLTGLSYVVQTDGWTARAPLERAARNGGDVGRAAVGAIAAIDNRWADARRALQGIAGWEAALLRAYVEGAAPDGDDAVSVREYRAALDDGPQFFFAYINMGRAQGDVGDLQGAVESFGRAIDVSDSALAYKNRGLLRKRMGDFAGALQDVNAAMERAPDAAELYYDRGGLYFRMRRFRDAVTDLARAVELDPELAEAWADLAGALHETGQMRESLEASNRALEFLPKDARVWSNRGFAKLALNDLDGARADFERSISFAPGASALVGLSQVAGRRREYERARSLLNRAIRLEPALTNAWLTRATAKQRLGDLRGAIADLDEAIRRGVHDGGAHAQRGELRWRAGDTQGAVADFTESIRRSPDYARPYYYRGMLRNEAGDTEGALADYAACIERDPRIGEAWVNRGNIHRRRGEYPQALECFTGAIQHRPELWIAWYSRACVYQTLDKPTEALADFDRAAELPSSGPDVYLQRGRLHWSEGRRDAALSDWRRALELAPPSWPRRRDAESLLARHGR